MDTPLKIAVCEDSPEDQEILSAILKSCPIANVPAFFSSGEQLLKVYAPLTYDLVLSDIYMGGISGVELVKQIRETDPEIPIGFITSSRDFALESYRLDVLKYIEKPYRAQEIQSILQLAKMNRDSAPALILIRSGREQRVRFSQILFLEQQTHYVNISLLDGSRVSGYEKLSALVAQLQRPEFYSPHKSYYVNLNHVRSLDGELRCFLMADGSRIPIRRESLSEAKKVLEEHLFQKARGCAL